MDPKDRALFSAVTCPVGPDDGADAVRKALADGGDVHARNEHGKTPLHEAVFWRCTRHAVINVLLDADADLNAHDIRGRTPLHEAARCENKDWSSRLDVERGERPTEPGFGSNLYAEVVEWLLREGADPSARDDCGKMPYEYAAENDLLEGTRAYWLLREGKYAKK